MQDGGHDDRAGRPQHVAGDAAGAGGEGDHDHPEIRQEDRHGDDDEEREQRRLPGEPRAPGAAGERRPIGRAAGAAAGDRVLGRHQCTSIRGGCSSCRMSISRHSASAATTPITTRMSESAAP